jgi:1,4-alpha-glucan branching enzyme
MEASRQVWSAKEGYPGDYLYRDFYRDVGFDLDLDYVRPFLHGGVTRVHTGIKYYRITGPGDEKEPYDADRALEQAAVHAGNFMFNRERQIEHLSGFLGRPPIVVAPYDAELFGHWWFEGPQWLDLVIRKCAFDQSVFRLTTVSEYLSMYPKCQVATPSLSSWGWKGYNEVWLGGSNDWVYRHLHWAAEKMVELANEGDYGDPIRIRALKQAAREVLLAQCSDWAFIMKTGTTVPYAVKRTREHILRFRKLYEDIKRHSIDTNWLSDVENKDNVFPELNYRIYADEAHVAEHV